MAPSNLDGDLRAAIDVGSNTIRLLVARVEDGTLAKILDDSRFVRLGSGVDASGFLNHERKEAGIVAIRELLSVAKELGCTDVRAVATSAVRDASDGRDYVERIKEETGLDIQIIGGDEEARLTYTGATAGIELKGKNLVCDLGGGSCEVIVASESGIRWSQSFQLGSGRLSEKFIRNDPPMEDERAAVHDLVLRTLRARGASGDAGVAIFTGGTATYIAHLLELSDDVVDVKPAQLEAVERTVYSERAAAIADRFHVRTERAAVLPAGITAIRAIAEWSDAGRLRITRNGIREGVILSA